MKKLVILFTLLTISQPISAYEYYNSTERGHSAQVRTWKLEDKSIATEGTFLHAIAGEIFIQQADQVVSFRIEILSWVDQKYVNQQLKEMEPAKKKSSTHLISWPRFSIGNQAQAFIILGLVLTFSLTLVWLSSRWSNMVFNNLN